MRRAAVVRAVAEADLESVVAMVHGLAKYERAAHQCHLTVDALRTALFGDRPALFGHVAQLSPDPAPDSADGAGPAAAPELVGCALWFLNFSTWDGVHGIYLEDLYVHAEHRGGGHGLALLAELAAECVRRGYTRLNWQVLDWNEPSIEFYNRLGAQHTEQWLGYQLDGAALATLAANR